MSNTQSVESTKSAIRAVEDNSQSRHNDGVKQSIKQDVKNSSTLGGSDSFRQGHKGGSQ